LIHPAPEISAIIFFELLGILIKSKLEKSVA
jgi:hypothetical protein